MKYNLKNYNYFTREVKTENNMTLLGSIKKNMAQKGVTVTFKRETQEFRVNYINGQEETAYYTDDLQDAIDTGNRYKGV